jgi:predicted nucleic acid-binding protein
MALYYFDASALVKNYILEPGSTWVRGLVEALASNGRSQANTIFISEASITESAAAFAVLHRTQRLSRQARDGAFRACVKQIAIGLFGTVPVITADFQMAAHLTQRHLLKAYDAVQLAVALRHSLILAAYKLTVTFVSGDNTLVTAAQAEGLRSDNPFEHILPQEGGKHESL